MSELSVVPFESSRHLAAVGGWLAKRGMPFELGPDTFPPNGFVVPGVAAGFMYVTDAPGAAYLDSYVANPEAGRDAIWEAIRLITAALVDRARRLGITLLHGSSDKHSIIHACQGLGFRIHPVPMTRVSLEIVPPCQ